jgi:GH15 family glucan-1,4-alpha-glucosidase
MRDDNGYAPISDYAFLSDCRSAALIAKDGAVDWLCWPRFDSPSLFGRLLDNQRAGVFAITPTDDYESTRAYLPNTNVLQTTFTNEHGSISVTDWLHKGSRQALCRLVVGLDGEMDVDVICDPRPDYGRGGPVVWHERFGYLVADLEDGARLVLEGLVDSTSRLRITQGDVVGITLGFNRPGPSELLSSLRRTVDFWEHWSQDLHLPAYKPEVVKRAALTLKGLQYEPSGAIIAAATASLPEQIGGGRNYDYRFSWMRDTVFTLEAFASVGKHDEAHSWLDWLKAIVLHSGSAHLQIMYGIDGETELPEEELFHLEGYKQSQPVRIGNAAAKQRQLDVYGEMLNSIYLQQSASSRPLNVHRWLLVRALAERACDEWRLPDEGIWEVRGGPRHFVYSKVMCWVALDRALKLAQENPHLQPQAEEIEEWSFHRQAIAEEVWQRGYNEKLQAFTQAYDSEALGAECLLLAKEGFVAADDPRFIGTVRAIQKNLTRNGLVDRYKQSETDDGFEGGEGTFTICSLWLCLALVQIKAHDEAQILFERVLAQANDLGLLSEELSPEGEQLGNFPQAFALIAIIACVFALNSDKRTALAS